MSQIIEVAKCGEYECRAVPVIIGVNGAINDILWAMCSGPECAHWEPEDTERLDEDGIYRNCPQSGRCGLSSR